MVLEFSSGLVPPPCFSPDSSPGTSSPPLLLSLLPAWVKSCSPCCFAVLGAAALTWTAVLGAWSCCRWRGRMLPSRCCPFQELSKPMRPCLEDVCMLSWGKLLAERCMLLLSLEKLPCGDGDELLVQQLQFFHSMLLSLILPFTCMSCCPAFVSCCPAALQAAGLLLLALKGGTRKGRQEGEVLPINFASYCSAAFAAGLVPHVSCLQQKPAPPHTFNKILQ
jgi:hypothetical protein